jgi:hypothetical protein
MCKVILTNGLATNYLLRLSDFHNQDHHLGYKLVEHSYVLKLQRVPDYRINANPVETTEWQRRLS